MKKLILTSFLAASALTLSATVAGAATVELYAKGDSGVINGAYFVEFTNGMQSTVSSGTGVIDPFLTIQNRGVEAGYNSDYSPLVLDTTRPEWNYPIQVSDLVTGPDLTGDPDVVNSGTKNFTNYYEFLLDFNEPNKTSDDQDANVGSTNLLTLLEFQLYLVPEAVGGSVGPDLAALQAVAYGGTNPGDPVFDMNGYPDNAVNLDYNIWNGSGQNMDMAVYVPIFAANPTDYVYLYTVFGDPDHTTKGNESVEKPCLRFNPLSGQAVFS